MGRRRRSRCTGSNSGPWMKLVNGTIAVRHDKKVRGGQFKAGVDVKASGKMVRSPFDAKIPHVYKDKTKCGNPSFAASQFTLGEETLNAKGDRHLTGRRVFVAHVVAATDWTRHVKEGDVLGYVSGDVLHVSSNHPDLLDEVI